MFEQDSLATVFAAAQVRHLGTEMPHASFDIPHKGDRLLRLEKFQRLAAHDFLQAQGAFKKIPILRQDFYGQALNRKFKNVCGHATGESADIQQLLMSLIAAQFVCFPESGNYRSKFLRWANRDVIPESLPRSKRALHTQHLRGDCVEVRFEENVSPLKSHQKCLRIEGCVCSVHIRLHLLFEVQNTALLRIDKQIYTVLNQLSNGHATNKF